MAYDYLMYTATVLYMTCYIPELYANYINKNANGYNIPEKIIMLTACSFGLSYSIATENTALIVNYAPNLLLDVLALSMRMYYAYCSSPPPPTLEKIWTEEDKVVDEKLDNKCSNLFWQEMC
jgi:uncharacterized protein with PQ loop repeat